MVSALPSKSKPTTSASVPPTPTYDPARDPDAALLKPTRPPPPNRARSGSAANIQDHSHPEDAKKLNRVLIILMRRLGYSKTFGENVIFMLNRAGESLLAGIVRITNVQKTHLRTCVCNCSFSRSSICCSPHLERRNTSTPMILGFCSMCSFGNWWTYRMRLRL